MYQLVHKIVNYHQDTIPSPRNAKSKRKENTANVLNFKLITYNLQ